LAARKSWGNPNSGLLTSSNLCIRSFHGYGEIWLSNSGLDV
jgi:hypothetical protein